MSDDIAEIEKTEVKPIRLSDNRRILPIFNNLAAIYKTHQDIDPPPNWESDADARTDKLTELGVHESWFDQDEVTGDFNFYLESEGKTERVNTVPWFKILKEARGSNDTIRMIRAEEFFRKANLAEPLYQSDNLELLQAMSTQEETEARLKVGLYRSQKLADDERVKAQKLTEQDAAEKGLREELEQEKYIKLENIAERLEQVKR